MSFLDYAQGQQSFEEGNTCSKAINILRWDAALVVHLGLLVTLIVPGLHSFYMDK